MSTLDLWAGEFGDEYHQRNQATAEQVKPVLAGMLKGIAPGYAYEPGCGRGQNLVALQEIGWEVCGAEPNEQARTVAKEHLPFVYADDIRRTPYGDDTFDLVLTAGLLIHIAPADIRKAVYEIARISYRYVLLIEYAAAEEETVEYRGRQDFLWRRPYGKLFQAWRSMKLIRHGGTEAGLYDGAEFWLLEHQKAS